ncbi:MAG TPA: hypothetical protein VGX25_24590 [Actinophytocola sp.]|uniref:hypothetical protein n=1 Tax=Actinophytocola sp. TaxID=1872138 RepID=UPI002DDCA81E|nr:hypothetical protein [Actinophytocola sp.]HEV2782585.1 hypothetical protein [Actinophytocola sp.]
MGRGRARAQQSPPGRRGLRPKRPSVPADPSGLTDRWFEDGDGEAGSAGVREPRHPKPWGPLHAASQELPVPQPPICLTLSDARR